MKSPPDRRAFVAATLQTFMTRRAFLATPLVLAAAPAGRPPLCIFSKHMAQFGWKELGQKTRQLGFDGVDLTTRPKGHVLPENVAQDLPKAVDAIRAAGVDVPMIATELLSTRDPAARPTLAAMQALKIPFWKIGYWRNMNFDQVKPLASGLFALSREHGVTAGLHNHSGTYYGAVPYEYKMLLDGVPPNVAGFYFDPRHAVVEGGDGGWKAYLQQALPRLKMVAIKDFFWEKTDGKWRIRNCPLGQGMVDFPAFFKAFAAAGFTGPISLHVEYESRDELEAIAADFAFMKKHVAAAYGTP